MFSRKWIMVAAAVLLVALPVSVAIAKKGSKGKNVIVNGTVKTIDTAGETVIVTVASNGGSTNKAGQEYRGEDVTFDLSDAKLQLGEGNTLEDVDPGDEAQVQAKVNKSTDTQPFKAKRFKDKTLLEAEGDDDDDTGTTPTTTTTTPTTTTTTPTTTTP